MANPGQLFGEAVIRLDGQVYKSKEGAKLNLGGFERDPKNGAGWTGFTQKRVPSEVEAEFALERGLSVKALNDADDITITFECDTGQTFVIANGWSAKPAELTDGDGCASTTFNGPPAQEML